MTQLIHHTKVMQTCRALTLRSKIQYILKYIDEIVALSVEPPDNLDAINDAHPRAISQVI